MRTEILGRDEILGVATDSLGREEILGHEDFVGRHHRNIQQIEQRAAGGNARAAAKLQRIQQRLQQRAATGDTQATAKLQQIQTWQQQNPAAAAALTAAAPQASYLAPGQYGQPAYQPQYGLPAYQSPYSQYAQPQYVNPYSTDPYSQYAQPQYAGQYAPQPTVDVYQGDESGLTEILGDVLGTSLPVKIAKKLVTAPIDAADWVARLVNRHAPSPLRMSFIGDDVFGAFVGDEAREMSGAGAVEQQAAARGSACGYNGAWRNIRPVRSGAFVGDDVAAMIVAKVAELKRRADAGDEGAKQKLQKVARRLQRAKQATSSGAFVGDDVDGRQAAKRILEDAAAQKSIDRDSLKRAIWLWAGKTSTVRERADVGSKMIAFLNKRAVKLT